MRKLAILSVLTLVVFFSGCLRQAGKEVGGGTQGVVITSFSPDISTIPPGETVTFSLDVENVGGREAKNVKATLYGAANAWTCTPSLDQSINSLFPPDPVAGTPGETDTFVWDCTAPDVPTEIPQDFYVDVYYDYTTEATGVLIVAEESYLKSLSSKERQEFYSTGGLKQLSVSSAPVSIDVVIPRPLIRGRDLTVRVIIRNVGGGKIVDDKLKSFETSGIDCSIQEGVVKLVRGEERTLRCSVSDVGNIVKKAEIPFTIKLEYTYVVQSSTSVTIKPGF